MVGMATAAPWSVMLHRAQNQARETCRMRQSPQPSVVVRSSQPRVKPYPIARGLAAWDRLQNQTIPLFCAGTE